MKVAYEIHTEYKGYQLSAYGIATFERDELQGTSTTYMDSNSRSWVDEREHHQLSHWQRGVTPDEFIHTMSGRII